ncbi:MAG: hypothetical protein IJ444_00340 [Kiritimatiellae bacterium]|nr:hypothetical protein [Kiritimatiellia bacterium]
MILEINGKDISNLEQLKDNFVVFELLEYRSKFADWLLEREYDEESEKVSTLDSSLSDEEWLEKVAEICGFDEELQKHKENELQLQMREQLKGILISNKEFNYYNQLSNSEKSKVLSLAEKFNFKIVVPFLRNSSDLNDILNNFESEVIIQECLKDLNCVLVIYLLFSSKEKLNSIVNPEYHKYLGIIAVEDKFFSLNNFFSTFKKICVSKSKLVHLSIWLQSIIYFDDLCKNSFVIDLVTIINLDSAIKLNILIFDYINNMFQKELSTCYGDKNSVFRLYDDINKTIYSCLMNDQKAVQKPGYHEFIKNYSILTKTKDVLCFMDKKRLIDVFYFKPEPNIVNIAHVLFGESEKVLDFCSRVVKRKEYFKFK